MNGNDVIEIPSKFTKAYPSISVETVHELIRRRLFHWCGDYWCFGDESNETTRRLDGRKFTRADNSGAGWHKLIGLADVVRHNRKEVLFVIEGSKDALAAAELAFRSGILEEMGIICALGSGYRPIASESEQLCSRRVELIGDRDTQTWNGCAETRLCWEVIRIRRREGFQIGGRFVEAAEVYPNSEAGFTLADRDAAFRKLLFLRDRQAVEK